MKNIPRRRFLKDAGAVALGFSGLHLFVCRSELASELKNPQDTGFGDLIPDPNRILDLPAGFEYQVLSRGGDTMDDGLFVPGKHDGMAAFAAPGGKILLVRNHELEPDEVNIGAFGPGNALLGQVDPNLFYDAGSSNRPALGGTTTLLYDPESRELQAQFLSLVGTVRNCAGGPTPWNSWITCEEAVQRAGGNFQKDHGFNFEVPATADSGLVQPVPLRAMGRFRHEAVAVHPDTGIVFQTEDRDDGLIYRFIPEMPGNLAAGGRLQALRLRSIFGADTRNWSSRLIRPGEPLEVEWLDLNDVESPGDLLRSQGFARGAAKFARGEGMWYGLGGIYFACTSGGANRTGQIWRYYPSPDEGTSGESDQPGRLELFIEPNSSNLLENADNVTVAPWGDLIICEDGPGTQFLIGVTPEGTTYRFARNALNVSEFAGATFAPDGKTFFVNIFSPGMTLAVTGPWANPTSVPDQSSVKSSIMNSQLHKNYPNPFNLETRIPVRLGAEAAVTLDIYDVTGGLVRRLDLGVLHPGEHMAAWDGLDFTGQAAPSGVYFIQMRAGQFTALQKAVLQK